MQIYVWTSQLARICMEYTTVYSLCRKNRDASRQENVASWLTTMQKELAKGRDHASSAIQACLWNLDAIIYVIK